MIFLVTAGRGGGGDGAPVYFTVPWSEAIAARGQMPGSIVKKLLEMQSVLMNEKGGLRTFRELTEPHVFMTAMGLPGYSLQCALGLTLCHRFLLELGMLGEPPG